MLSTSTMRNVLWSWIPVLPLCGALAVPPSPTLEGTSSPCFGQSGVPGSQAKVRGGNKASLQGRVLGMLAAGTLHREPGWPVSLLWS